MTLYLYYFPIYLHMNFCYNFPVLSTLLLTKNEDSMIEVTRVLGNLSRSKDVRDYILEIGGM